MRLRASLGQGFRAPNFNELYYPGFGGLFAGNPLRAGTLRAAPRPASTGRRRRARASDLSRTAPASTT